MGGRNGFPGGGVVRGLRVSTRALLVGVLAAVGLSAVGVSPAAAGATLKVGSGQPYPTIQSAVDAAKSGDLIVVMPGTYQESVVIDKSGLTIRGALNQALPVVVPPPAGGPICNLPNGPGQAGFCITTSPVPGTINNTEIARIEVDNFSQWGIAAWGTNGLNIHDVIATNNGTYGIASYLSSHTQIVHNVVSGSTSGLSPAGIFVGDSVNASLLIRLNTVLGNNLGIHVRDAAHGTVSENTATGNCIGIEVQDTGFDPTLTFDWTVVHNTTDNNTACIAFPVSGVGLVVSGAAHSRLTANEASSNGVGLAVTTGSGTGGTDPSYLQIDNNQLINNNPFDLYYDGTGTAVVFAHNTCTGGPC